MQKIVSFSRFFLFAFMLSITMSVYAANASSELATLLNSLHSMRANFTQTVYDNRNRAVQQSYGRMALQRPGKFRWEVTKPIPQLIIANDSRLWIYDADLEQVTIRSFKQAAGETPALLLSHTNIALENNYHVKELQKNSAGLRWFELTPKKSENSFSIIQMGFMNDQIKQMQLQDHLGHRTLIQFQKSETNVKLSPSLFIFKAPANVDVINETHQR